MTTSSWSYRWRIRYWLSQVTLCYGICLSTLKVFLNYALRLSVVHKVLRNALLLLSTIRMLNQPPFECKHIRTLSSLHKHWHFIVWFILNIHYALFTFRLLRLDNCILVLFLFLSIIFMMMRGRSSLTTFDLSLSLSLHPDSFSLCIYSCSHTLFSSMISIVVVIFIDFDF